MPLSNRVPGKALLLGGAVLVAVSAMITLATKVDGRRTVLAASKSDSPTVVLEGGQQLRPFVFDGDAASDAMAIDARKATFVLANSRNPHPTQGRDCSIGATATNPYPFSARDAPRLKIIGGLFVGQVPQTSDWRFTYCNSAAVHLRRSPNVTVEGIRISEAWDGVRAATGSPNLTVKSSWLSNIRDDSFENDYLYSMHIMDTLIDGTFQGISVQPSSNSRRSGAGEFVTMSGVLVRLQEYLYRGESRFGALTKNRGNSPQLRIRNTVVAIDRHRATTWPGYWERTWSSIAEGRNNRLLWLSDLPLPASFPLPGQSSGFQILTGEAARRTWEEAKQNWIDCHPQIGRLPSDPKSDPRRCNPSSWGGYSLATEQQL